jgi:tetratricopeptide (TPR) repeat protein
MKRLIHTITIITSISLLLSCISAPEEIETLYKAGNYDQAVSEINKRQFFYVGELKLLHIRALCYEKLGKPEEAMEDYEQILNYNSTYALAYAGIGKILFEQKKYTEAELPILKAASLEPDNFDILYLAGRVQLMVQNREKAEIFLKNALKINPNSASIHYYTGMARANRGDIYGAAASFNTYIQKEPDNLVARYNRGFALLKIGYLPWALEDFEFVLKNNPNHYEALGKKGICLAKMGNPEGCQLIQEAAKKGSDYAMSKMKESCL